MKTKLLRLSFLFLCFLFSFSVMAQEPSVDMKKWIELTVKKDAKIKMKLSTLIKLSEKKVKIVNGTEERPLTIECPQPPLIPATVTTFVIAQGTTIRIYGGVPRFSCYDNNENITAVDVSNDSDIEVFDCSKNTIKKLNLSKNTKLRNLDCSSNKLSGLDLSRNLALERLDCTSNQLSELNLKSNKKLRNVLCGGNKLSACSLDKLYDDLADCSEEPEEKRGVIKIWKRVTPPVEKDENPGYKTSQHAIATQKKWKVQDGYGNPITNTLFACPANNERWIELSVKANAEIKMELYAKKEGTPIEIVSGSRKLNTFIGTSPFLITTPKPLNFTADGTTIKVYGDVIDFECINNKEKVVALNLNKNPGLEYLDCSGNTLENLDLSQNLDLKILRCDANRLQTLDLSKNLALKILYCRANNGFQTLDVTKNINLEELDCSNNPLLESIDLNENVALQSLYCSGNGFAVLDFSKNSNLRYLSCFENKLSACSLDSLYASLPSREGKKAGVVVICGKSPVNESKENPGYNGSDYKIATAKNWKVQDDNKIDIANTSFACLKTGLSVLFGGASGISSYPCPVIDHLQIESKDPMIELTLLTTSGVSLMRVLPAAQERYSLDLSQVAPGLYFVQVRTTKERKLLKILKK